MEIRFDLLYFVRLLLVASFFTIILSTPVWIHAVSAKAWKSLTKKITISIMVLFFASFSLYGLLRPVTGSLSWIGQVAIVLYLIAVVVTAYFSWPRP
jgi:hypothetical protein